MGTTATIAVKTKEGIKAIGVNFDGGPEHTGVILAGWYNTPEKANALIALGNLSQLNERIAPNDGEEHSWAQPAAGVTIAYHRDRGERMETLGTFRTERAITGLSAYTYLFDGERWLVWGLSTESEWIGLQVTIGEGK